MLQSKKFFPNDSPINSLTTNKRIEKIQNQKIEIETPRLIAKDKYTASC